MLEGIISQRLYLLSLKSGCRSRHIAAVIVKNASMIGNGVNFPMRNCIDHAHAMGGPFRNIVDDGKTCPRYLFGAKSGELMGMCTAVHAERNAIIDAIRHGYNIEDLRGASMYMNCECPCHECAQIIVEVGITDIYIIDKPDYDPRGREILTAGGVHIHTWKA